MNKPWDGIRNPTSDKATENKYVKRLIPPRVKQFPEAGHVVGLRYWIIGG